ncbi:MAG TPA: helix-turn-helix domain-containing protein [Acidimicrobiales bacterium]|nr:helix-turn-helix domain-containing protein [Acidimicrobiales bacterium]
MAPENPTSELPKARLDNRSAMRDVNDPKTLRALTHPVRLALLEALALEGPLTATAAGELIGESPTTCSFHFRQLAKYGFVEEAESGPGRLRPWKIVNVGMRFSDVTEDAETSIAAKSLEQMVFERAMSRLASYINTKSSFPKVWQEASQNVETILWVTPAELEAVTHEILAIFNRFLDRISDASLRTKGSLPVEALMFTYPVRPPGSPQ